MVLITIKGGLLGAFLLQFEYFVTFSLANAMGSLYVRKFFQEDAKAAAVEMVNDIKETFFEILDTIDWMDEETR